MQNEVDSGVGLEKVGFFNEGRCDLSRFSRLLALERLWRALQDRAARVHVVWTALQALSSARSLSGLLDVY